MNYIFVYDEEKNLKYRFSSVESGEYDGTIKALNAFFTYDDTGTELESGTAEFVVKEAGELLTFSQTDFFVVKNETRDFGTFYITEAEKESYLSWKVTAIDDIGRAEKKSIRASWAKDISLSTYLKELFGTADIAVSISPELDDRIIDGGEFEQSTLREIAQKISLGLGITYSTMGGELKIGIKPTHQDITHNYSADNVYENPNISSKDSYNGVINLNNSKYFDFDIGSSHSYDISGFVPIGEKMIITPYSNPVIPVDPYVEGTRETPHNGYYKHRDDNIVISHAISWSTRLRNERNIDEYLTVRHTFDNFVEYSIDREALEDVFLDSGEGKYIDGDGKEYAFISLAVSKAIRKTDFVGNAVIGNGINEGSTITLPYVDDAVLDRITNSFNRSKSVEYKVEYSGESLGEIVKLPKIWGEEHHAIIKKVSLNFSASKVFAEITADVLSSAEEGYIVYNGAEYGDGTEYGDDTEYGGYEVYEESDQ